MIVIRFMGGLGNQLFQYALGRHLSLIHHRHLRFDTSGYTATKPDAKQGTRLFGLGAFSVNGQSASPDQLLPFEMYRRRGTAGRLARLANRWTPHRWRRFIVEQEKDFWQFRRSVLTSPLAKEVWIQGYWQTEKYFEDIAPIIRNELGLKQSAVGENAEMLATISALDSVSVHVRHGDNASALNPLGVLPIGYYEQAAGLITKQIPKPHFFVFSDDPEWAKAKLRLPAPTTFVVRGTVCPQASNPSPRRTMSRRASAR